MNLTYRALAREDLPAICAFPEDARELFFIGPRYEYPLTPEPLWAFAQERRSPTVIVDRNTEEVLAYANLYDLDEAASLCWLGNVVVSPRARGSGVAAFLLESMMEQARSVHGMRRLHLMCHNVNTRAMLFYLKHGFAPSGGYRITDSAALGQKIVSIEMERAL